MAHDDMSPPLLCNADAQACDYAACLLRYTMHRHARGRMHVRRNACTWTNTLQQSDEHEYQHANAWVRMHKWRACSRAYAGGRRCSDRRSSIPAGIHMCTFMLAHTSMHAHTYDVCTHACVSACMRACKHAHAHRLAPSTCTQKHPHADDIPYLHFMLSLLGCACMHVVLVMATTE